MRGGPPRGLHARKIFRGTPDQLHVELCNDSLPDFRGAVGGAVGVSLNSPREREHDRAAFVPEEQRPEDTDWLADYIPPIHAAHHVSELDAPCPATKAPSAR